MLNGSCISVDPLQIKQPVRVVSETKDLDVV